MNIFIICLTILLIYGILHTVYKAWKAPEYTDERQKKIREKMEEIEETEEAYNNVVNFKKTHKGNLNKKQKTIETFTKE